MGKSENEPYSWRVMYGRKWEKPEINRTAEAFCTVKMKKRKPCPYMKILLAGFVPVFYAFSFNQRSALVTRSALPIGRISSLNTT